MRRRSLVKERRTGMKLAGVTVSLVFIALALAPVCTAFGAAGPERTQVYAGDEDIRAAIEKVDAFLAATVKEADLPGLSAGIVCDQDLVWSKGYGLADIQKGTPADADTIYEIGSVTKLFNAVLLMQMRDEGKLNLDDPVEKYLPEFRMKSPFPDQRPPTFRQMVSHVAGLPREYDFDTSHPGELRQFPAAVVLAGIGDKEIQYGAYTGFHYSNLGIYIIGQALQRIAGKPYAEYMAEHVFAPLGMSSTGWEYTDAMKPHRAVGYLPAQGDGPRVVAPLFVPGDFGVSAGGIQSSVRDMARFLSLQFRDGPAGGAQVLGGTTLREMRSSVVPASNWKWGMGIGWEIESIGEHNGICHGGATQGFSSRVRAVPDLKLGFVLLMNQDADQDAISRQAVELLTPAFEKSLAATSDAQALPAYASAFTGHYSGDFGKADIVIRDGRLMLLPEGPDAPWVLEVRDERTLGIVSGSKAYDGMTIAFQPATRTSPATFTFVGVTFTRGDSVEAAK
jgi:D-alanyl-D-alanine carboxypeptidase